MPKTVTYFHTANYEVTCRGPALDLRNRNNGVVSVFTGPDARELERVAFSVPVQKLDQVLASYER